MNVLSFSNKNIAVRMLAAIALFALLTSIVPSQAFAITVPPTCNDEIQNQDETGIDIGGVCSADPIPCPEGTTGDFEPACTPIAQVPCPLGTTGTFEPDCAPIPLPPPISGCMDDGALNYNSEATVSDDSCEYREASPSVCDIGDNLLENPSFELPVIDGTWAISNLTDWVVTNDADVVTQTEIWRGYAAPSEGLQNVELGANERTMITQTVNTTVGATYELRFDFAARGNDISDNNVNALVDGNVIMNENSGNTSWVTRNTTFVATDTTTDIAFRDIGTPNSTGSLIDNAVLCFVSDPVIVPPRTFKIFGYVWHDDNQNDLWDGREENSEEVESELPLEGRTITITNDEYSTTTTTNSEGYYEFEVPRGTWIITETLPEGWEHTYIESYEVTVPEEELVTQSDDGEGSLFDSLREFFIPTAHAQFIAIPIKREYGEYNFGNDESTIVLSGGGGGGALMRPADRTPTTGGGTTEDTDDTDDSAPTPAVLGEQVSIVPAGAPAAGGGGTSPVSINLPTLLAVFTGRRRLDV